MSEPAHLRGGATDRLHALDLCRGICALGVAAYHMSLWGETDLLPALKSTLALFGTYGVSVFFILSGYSLAHAYDTDFPGRIEPGPLAAYFRRRIGRLAPLFVVVVVATLLGKAVLVGKSIDLLTFIANVTLLFGFANPAATPVVGGWSIGVEVVFYVVFPLLLVLRDRAVAMLAAAVVLTAWVSTDIARAASLPQGWNQYVSPANHWVFFCAGVYARLHAPRWRIGVPLALAAIGVGLAVAAVACLGASELQIVTGWRRALLVLISVAIVMLVGHIPVQGSAMQAISKAMGGASYPLYLVHPLLFFALRGRIEPGAAHWWIGLVASALVLAFLADRYLDSTIQRRIKRLGW